MLHYGYRVPVTEFIGELIQPTELNVHSTAGKRGLKGTGNGNGRHVIFCQLCLRKTYEEKRSIPDIIY